MEDDVRRHALFAGEFHTLGFKRLPQRVFVGSGEGFAQTRAVFRFAGFAFGRFGIAAQPHRLFAAQHGACCFGEFQSAVGFHVDIDQSGGDELAIDAAPLRLRQVLADAEGTQLLVVELLDLGCGLAQQHVDQMRDAEALAGAIDAGQRHLRSLRSIPGIHG